MEMSAILPVITTAMTVGLGCGACCSPVISMFLSTYVVSHANGVKKGVLAFASFFVGKIISVSALCMAAAAISRQFIGIDGHVGSFNLRLFAQVIMSTIGLVMIVRWVREGRKPQENCQSCHGCGGEKKPGREGVWPVFSAGLTYGFTPCAPLLMMIGYSFTLPVALAGLNGVVFGLSSAASPVLLLVIISGALSKRLAKEIPHYLKWFRLASYLILMVMPFLIEK